MPASASGLLIMRNISTKQTISYAFGVMLLCYLPHLFTNPWWLSVLIIAVIIYRLIVEYFRYSLPNIWVRLFLVTASLCLLFSHYRLSQSSNFYIGFLLLFTALKVLEANTLRDLQVLVLCNLYVMLSALLLNQALWIFLYAILGVLANLALMVKIIAPTVDLKHTGKSLMKHFFLAIPLSLLLFYIFPRLSHPLWRVPTLSQNKTGFSEEMTFDNLSEIFDDDSTAMRIVFNQQFKPSLYWRGRVLSQYNGWSWKASSTDGHQFRLLKSIEAGGSPSYEVLLEPHQKKWLFYQENPIAAQPGLMFAPSAGLMQQDKTAIYERFDYSLIDMPVSYLPINKSTIQQNIYLPPYGNPRLKEWAKQQFATVKGNAQAFIGVISHKINTEPYWYSLTTGNTAIKANLMDSFWFETKRGYCEHYTSAVAIALRAVGIPARVIVGYHGGKWNPISHYLTVRQNDAHAWLEYWQKGIGWKQLDPVTFIAPERIDRIIHKKQLNDYTQDWLTQWSQDNAALSWTLRAGYFLESAQFFWERWLLFYNQDTQHVLLQKIGLDQWDEIKLFQAFVLALVLILLIGAAWYIISLHLEQDPLLKEYHRLQREMHRLDVHTLPPATLAQQLHELSLKHPQLKVLLDDHVQRYELLRLQQSSENIEQRLSILQLFRSLRKRLKNIKMNF